MASQADRAAEDGMPYRERKTWADVVPVPQDDGPDPACPIAYTDEYRDVMDYFRALVKSDELSARAFNLTTDAIELNAANYTVWHFRRRVIDELKVDLQMELDYIGEMIEENPKNYQVWYHRRALIERIGDGANEPQFTEEILQIDAKNYHAWQHRHWAMEKFGLFATLPGNGLGYVDTLLAEDVRNNSAWNHRYWVHTQTGGFTPAVLGTEVTYALRKLSVVTDNESAWNYIKGICEHSENGLLDFPAVKARALELQATPGQMSTHPMSTLLDVYELEAKAGQVDATTAATDLCAALEQHDAVRVRYWEHRRALLA